MNELYDEEKVMEMIRIAAEGGRKRALADAKVAVEKEHEKLTSSHEWSVTAEREMLNSYYLKTIAAIEALEEGKDE